jgi:hypothetical protein
MTMKTKMLGIDALEAYINENGTITISNDRDDGSLVVVHPDQVDTLCRWLEQLKPQSVAAILEKTLEDDDQNGGCDG